MKKMKCKDEQIAFAFKQAKRGIRVDEIYRKTDI